MKRDIDVQVYCSTKRPGRNLQMPGRIADLIKQGDVQQILTL